MAALYQEGKTLQEVGDAFGLTRERVRQILRRAGVAKTSGGSPLRTKRRRAAIALQKRIERDARAQEWFGCYDDEMLALNGGKRGWSKGTPASRFIMQRRNAQNRGIEWNLTFPEWMFVWQESGHFDERGRAKSKYVMARYRDLGPYELGNVYITTNAGNASDYQAELKRRGVACSDGYRRLPERAAVMEQGDG